MNKQQALKELQKGNKVSHPAIGFEPLKMEAGKIIFTDGKMASVEQFNSWSLAKSKLNLFVLV